MGETVEMGMTATRIYLGAFGSPLKVAKFPVTGPPGVP